MISSAPLSTFHLKPLQDENPIEQIQGFFRQNALVSEKELLKVLTTEFEKQEAPLPVLVIFQDEEKNNFSAVLEVKVKEDDTAVQNSPSLPSSENEKEQEPSIKPAASKKKSNYPVEPIGTLPPAPLLTFEKVPVDTKELKALKNIAPVYVAAERAIETLVQTNSLSTTFTTTYIAPHSFLNGLEITLELFDTHPRSIKIQMLGNPETMKKLSSQVEDLQNSLAKRFEGIEFIPIITGFLPLLPQTPPQQKSQVKVSEKKAPLRKVIFKSLKQAL